MEIKRKKIVLEKDIPVYVAKDGKEFDNICDCLDYEQGEVDKVLKESQCVIEDEEIRGRKPFDGAEHSDNSDYRWVKPVNEMGVDLLNELFELQIDETYINKWICLEIYDDSLWCSTLESCIEYAKMMIEHFGEAEK